METFFWLALALPAVTDDFFTNLILMLVAPVIVVVGGLLVTEYLRVGIAIKILLAVISFGFLVLYGAGLFMAIYVLLLRRPIRLLQLYRFALSLAICIKEPSENSADKLKLLR
jgi:hypothetical protein